MNSFRHVLARPRHFYTPGAVGIPMRIREARSCRIRRSLAKGGRRRLLKVARSAKASKEVTAFREKEVCLFIRTGLSVFSHPGRALVDAIRLLAPPKKDLRPSLAAKRLKVGARADIDAYGDLTSELSNNTSVFRHSAGGMSQSVLELLPVNGFIDTSSTDQRSHCGECFFLGLVKSLSHFF